MPVNQELGALTVLALREWLSTLPDDVFVEVHVSGEYASIACEYADENHDLRRSSVDVDAYTY